MPPLLHARPSTHDYELLVMLFFNAGAATGFISLLSGLIQNTPPAQLTANVTASFLMSICGNCTRILAKPEVLPPEKITITLAVMSYALALVCDGEKYSELAIYLKLATTGCVGLWNAMQVMRLHPEIRDLIGFRPCFSTATPTDFETKIAFTAFCSYSLGALTGFGSMFRGIFIKLLLDVSPERLAPYITLAFLMSHMGNLVRTEFNRHALVLEKNYVRADVLFYFFALCSDFFPQYKLEEPGALAKLASAGFMGLWNTAQTWRVHPAVYDAFYFFLQDPVVPIGNEGINLRSTPRNYQSISGRHSVFTYGRAITISPEESVSDIENGCVNSP